MSGPAPGDAALDAAMSARAFTNRIFDTEAGEEDDLAMEGIVASFERIKDVQDRFFAKGADSARSAVPPVIAPDAGAETGGHLASFRNPNDEQAPRRSSVCREHSEAN